MSSRRDFVFQSLAGLGSTWLTAQMPAILAAAEHAHQAGLASPPAKLEFFASDQAAEVEAIAAQIIPTTDTPGAREAGVIYFIDRALVTFDREKQDLYRQGLEALQAKSAERFPGSMKFSSLTSAQQVELLQAIERSAFFEQARIHTIMGFLANPEYGGNHNQVGWKLIGFEDEFHYEPPFGFYDRDFKPGK